MRLVRVLCLLSIGFCAALLSDAQNAASRNVEVANAAFIASPTETNRNALAASLADYSGAPTVQTVSAYIGLLAHDQRVGDQGVLYQSASAAAAHLSPVASIVPKPYLEARFHAASAQFKLAPAPAAMIEMAHVEGRARSHTNQLGEHPEWAETLKWKADVWGMAMEAYFDGEREPHPTESEIQAILASYGADIASRNALAARSLDRRGLPFCAGKMIQRPAMKFPPTRETRGQYGAIVLEFDLDAEGQVMNQKVLASVPEGVFDERALETLGQWKFRPDNKSSVGSTCRLERTNMVQPLAFELR